MNKILLLITSLVLIGSVGSILAQETSLPAPGYTPDSPFYFLERISEGIRIFFTFGDLKKVERYAKLATERIAEVQAVVEKGKPEAAEKALKRYEDQLSKALAKAQAAKTKGQNIEKATETVAEATGKHLLVLEEVLEKVPEKAKEVIVKAKEVSMAGQKNALKALIEENPERATEINLKTTEGRLNRAKAKAAEGETAEVEKAVKEFENQYKFGEEISQIAQGLGKDITTVEQLVGRATSLHLEVLAEVYEKVPEQAKPAIEKAMEVSVRGHQRAVEVLKEKNALDEIPEEVPVPEQVPEEVKKRVLEYIIPHGVFICGVSEEEIEDLRERLDKFNVDLEIGRPEIFVADCPEGITTFRITGLARENCQKVKETLAELEYVKTFGECVKPSEEPAKIIRGRPGVSCGGWDILGEVVCVCEGQLKKFVCPAGAVCDAGRDICYGECGACKCYQGPAKDDREMPCGKEREKIFKEAT